eukprot:s1182_g39.t1
MGPKCLEYRNARSWTPSAAVASPCPSFAVQVCKSCGRQELLAGFPLQLSDGAVDFGLLRRKKPLRLAVTGVPMGLSEEQQTRLARAPFLIPWEFLPFHSGRLVGFLVAAALFRGGAGEPLWALARCCKHGGV